MFKDLGFTWACDNFKIPTIKKGQNMITNDEFIQILRSYINNNEVIENYTFTDNLKTEEWTFRFVNQENPEEIFFKKQRKHITDDEYRDFYVLKNKDIPENFGSWLIRYFWDRHIVFGELEELAKVLRRENDKIKNSD